MTNVIESSSEALAVTIESPWTAPRPVASINPGAVQTKAPTLIRAGLAGLTKHVSVHMLEPVYTTQRVVIPIRWVATGIAGELFPVLDANLELHATADDTTDLVFVGSYRPPFGRAGAVVDHVLMHRVAERTLRSFLDHVVGTVTATPMPQRRPSIARHSGLMQNPRGRRRCGDLGAACHPVLPALLCPPLRWPLCQVRPRTEIWTRQGGIARHRS